MRCLVLTSFCLALPLVHAAERAPRITPPVAYRVTGEKRSADVTAAAEKVVEGTNELRAKEGRKPLAVNRTLAAAAQEFAAFMAGTDRFGHEADGLQPSERIERQGYEACITAENLAYQFMSTGFSTEDLAKSLINGWTDSPGHHRNMVDPDVTEIGVGIARSPKSGKYYAVQEFGRPQSLKLDFSVRNDAGAAVRYSIDEESLPLPAGATITHMTCRPTKLVFRWPGKQAPTEVSALTQQQYAIKRNANGVFRVEQSPFSSGRTP